MFRYMYFLRFKKICKIIAIILLFRPNQWKYKMKKLLLLFLALSIKVGAQDCDDVKREVDKFDGTTTHSTPYKNNVVFMKMSNAKDTTVALILTSYGRSLSSGEGVIILLSDGSKIDLPSARINYDASESQGWRYTCIYRPSKEDLKKLNSATITDYRLYIFEYTVPVNDQKKYSNYLKCILAAK